MRRSALLASSALALGAVASSVAVSSTPAQAQAKPTANYWMTVDTSAGFTGATRLLDLRLYSTGSATPPQAAHVVPGGMKIGPSLPLITPAAAPRSVPSELDELREFQRQTGKVGRFLLYWGCGEQVGTGQPFVVDLNALLAGRVPPTLTSLRIVGQALPSVRSARTYGEWPQPDSPPVPMDASLVGDHVVSGNYSPEIRFSLNRDFMGPLSLSVAGLPSGAANVTWPTVNGALGYSLQSFGLNAAGDMIFWTSANVRDFGSGLMGHMPDSEVARLVRQRAVLPPTATSCAIPAPVVKDVEGTFVNGAAYGGEQNFSFPPKPAKAPKSWRPDWTAKVRFLSTGSALVAAGGQSVSVPSVPAVTMPPVSPCPGRDAAPRCDAAAGRDHAGGLGLTVAGVTIPG